MIDRRLISNFDWLFLFLVYLVGLAGVVVVYSATTGGGTVSSDLWLRQIYWLAISFGLILLVISIDYHYLGRWSYLLYGLNMLALIYLLLRGGDHKVDRWFKLGPLTIQPSEFMKIIMILVMGQYFQRNSGRPVTFKDVFFLCCLMGVPLLLIVKQPDLGTAMTLVPVFFIVMYVGGTKIRYLLGLILSAVAMAPMIWLKLKDYQKMRIISFLDPGKDPLGAGYHLIQSQIAVGSGGILGKGYLAGTQNRLDFLPAQHTDFIFSVLSEEWGFIGAFIVLLVVFFVILRGIEIAMNAKDQLGVLLAVGVLANYAAHVMINVGMVIGLLPVTGIPFPLLSYGGSSTLAVMGGIGILLNIRMRRFSAG